MRIYSAVFSATGSRLSLPTWTTERGAAASLAAPRGFVLSGRYLGRFVELILFAILLALIALPAPTRAQSITMGSLTETPSTVQPGQTVVFTVTMTANENASNYRVVFSLLAPGAAYGDNITQQQFVVTFKAAVPLTQMFSWTVPAGTSPGSYRLYVEVYSSTNSWLGTKSTVFTVQVPSTPAPRDIEPPVVSGTAQVGKVLASTTGTWTGATSYAYQWAGNSAEIAGATSATYTPVSTDVGHTLTSTVTATGSSGVSASATSAPTVPIVAANSGSSSSASNGVAFTALHTYYMSPAGSDNNNGLTPTTPWATPNHAVVCGDVIIASAGSYSGMGYFGKVSNCPSTTGGIDGTGGIYFATVLCGGPDLASCNSNGGFQVWSASNWAVEGFNSTAPTGYCYLAAATASSTNQASFIAFINDIAQTCDDGFTTGDGGMNHNNPGNGIDEFAVVGDIAYQANNDPICVGAIDDPGPSLENSLSGTHVIYDGNFAIKNLQQSGCGGHDGEGLFWDTWDAHGYTGQGVMENNWVVESALYGIAVFQQSYNTGVSYPTMYILNNTLFANNGALLSS